LSYKKIEENKVKYVHTLNDPSGKKRKLNQLQVEEPFFEEN
jgi:hypothetical protein